MKEKGLFITLVLGLSLTLALLWALGDHNPPAMAAPLVPPSGRDWDGLSIGGPAVISAAGQYHMWYQGRGLSFYGFGSALGYAASSDGLAWAKYAGNPVLEPGEPGEWDSAYRGQVAVLEEGGLYKMWYSGGPPDGAWQTGYATSTNGLDWNIYSGNPVLEAGAAGSWDEIESDGPSVIKDGATYKMWYHGCNADYTLCSIGYATSPDGVTWTKHAGNPVLQQTPGQWDESGLGWPRVIKNVAGYEMWYYSGGKLGRATSPDGAAWIKYAGNPVLSEGWDGAGVSLASVLLEGGTYKLWTTSGAGATRGIGYLESTNGITWTQPVSNPLLVRGETGVIVNANYGHNNVRALTLGSTPITITVGDAGGVKATISGVTNPGGWYYSWEHEGDWDPGQPDIVPGDIVSASAAGYAAVVDPVGAISGVVDLQADTVAGTIQAGWFTQTLPVFCEVWVENGPPAVETSAEPDGGSYTCDLASVGWDLLPGQTVAVSYVEPDGDAVTYPFQAPHARANTTWNAVDGWFGPGVTVWYTVTDQLGVFKGGASGTAKPDGWMDGVGCGCDLLPGDRITVTSDAGLNAVLVPISITGDIDVAADTVSGHMSGGVFPAGGYVEVWSEASREGFNLDIDIEADGSYSADLAGQFDLRVGDTVNVWYGDPNGNHLGTEFRTLRLDVNYGHDWVYAATQPSASVVVTVTGKAVQAGQADSNGDFYTHWAPQAWVPNPPNIQPGDVIVVAAAGFESEVDPVGTIDGALDVEENTVAGSISAPWFSQPLRVRCEVWVENGPPGIETEADPDGGSYACDFDDVGWDLAPGQDVAVRYYEPDGDAVINVFSTPWMRVNYADDWVGGNYPAGHTLWITVTDAGGALKATAEVSATPGAGWGSDGFETQPDNWSPDRPDLASGDWVHFRSDDGYTNTIHVGDITGALDLAENTVSGTITAGWFTQTLRVRCEVWYVPSSPDGIETTAEPDGGGYLCDYDDVGWDLLPGHGASVRYHEPDGDAVINVFVVRPLGLRIVLPDRGIHGFYEAGHTIWLTVTDGVSVKATAVVTTAVQPWGAGFMTEPDDWAPSGQPWIMPYDWVYGQADDGMASEVQIGVISGQVSSVEDSVSGTIYAPWFGQVLDVECHSWGKPGDEIIKWTTVMPDGVNVYHCAWDPVTEWDILPGQEVGVAYSGPDGNWVASVFQDRIEATIYLPLILKNQ